jgi:hypothetical protein
VQYNIDMDNSASDIVMEGHQERRHWPVRLGPLSEMEKDEPDLSLTTTVEERFAIMWQLAQDAWAFRGEPVGEPTFSRHIGCLIRGRS